MLISYDKIREKVTNFSQSSEIFNFCIINLENLTFLNSGQIKSFIYDNTKGKGLILFNAFQIRCIFYEKVTV